jgi:hypothetical protein
VQNHCIIYATKTKHANTNPKLRPQSGVVTKVLCFKMQENTKLRKLYIIYMGFWPEQQKNKPKIQDNLKLRNLKLG